MIRSLIVDDEPRAIKTLEILLERNCPNIELIGTANNIKDAYQIIVSDNPDLVFLDINMPNGSGLDLLAQIKDKEKSKVIFTTAYEEYAIKAFRLSAVDYLLKPIDKKDLVEAVNRFEELQTHSTSDPQIDVISEILTRTRPKRIAINTQEGIHVVNLDQIIYLKSDKNYSFIETYKESIIASKPIGEFEKLLDDYDFVRTHRAYIVNLSHVKEFNKKEMNLILDRGHSIEVSRSKKEYLLERLGGII